MAEWVVSGRGPMSGYQVNTGELVEYKISDVDDTNDIKYYGFVDKDGHWYILKEDTSVDPKTYRYAQGANGYKTAWENRLTQTYDYFDVIF